MAISAEEYEKLGKFYLGREYDIKKDELEEGLGEWLDAYDAVQDILNGLTEEPYEIEDWSGRIVDGKVVRLIVRDGRELKVVRGTLTDDSPEG